jgi:hypothetical protein
MSAISADTSDNIELDDTHSDQDEHYCGDPNDLESSMLTGT